MRVGRGPLKGVSSGYQATETTVVVVVCIPSSAGYYEERTNILKVCLESITRHADAPYDLMVIDNSSIRPVRSYLDSLARAGVIDHLILNSRNLGISGALNIAFNAAPGQYIAFSNDDIFFHQGWLSAHLEVLEAFPEAGMVSGQLIATADSMINVTNLADQPQTTVTDFTIPNAWIEQWAMSTGLTLEQFLERPWAEENRHTFLIERHGVKTYAGMTGYSHVFRKDVLREVDSFPLKTGIYSGDHTDVQFAHALRDADYYWLTTFDKTTEHLGNHLDLHWGEKLKRFGFDDVIDLEKAGSRSPITRAGNPRRRQFAKRAWGKAVRHKRSQRLILSALRRLESLRY